MSAARALLLCSVAAWLAGCGMFGGPKPVKPGWDSLTLVAAPDANANTALAVDVVLVKDQGVLDALLGMSAAKYFSATAGLQRTFPDGLTVLSLEIVPGQILQVAPGRYKNEKAWSALAFANYATPGDHRERLLLDHGAYTLQLGPQEFTAVSPHP